MKNKVIKFDDVVIDYATFGRGSKNLIVIPGVGDGIKTVKGTSVIFSLLYKKFSKDYKVYVLSRRRNLPFGFTTIDMADDVVKSMDELAIDKADVVGVSQGGMIAQYIAINYPERVNKLVLAITSSRPNALLTESVDTWLKLLNDNDFTEMLVDNCKRSYIGKACKKRLKVYKLLAFVAKPKDYERFIIQALSCKNHNAYDKLSTIKNETLVIGAGLDGILGVEASYEIHNEIKGSKLVIFEEYSHGVYEENREFSKIILKFLKSNNL